MGSVLHRAVLILSLIASGCATAGRVGGAAGPVEWEIIDVGRLDSVDGNRWRWSYTIVLKEKAGTPIEFERIDRGALAQTLETGGIARIDFKRRLEANGELRYHTTDDWGWAPRAGPQFGGVSPLGPLTMEKQFVGKDARGQAVVVPVRVMLDRSFGRASRQPPTPEPPTPPAKSLQPQDLKSLAGRWEGYYRTPNFQIPIEAVIRDDGSVEFGENDPVTNRFRGTLSIREGHVWYAARDTADFAYHEGSGRHVLVGHLTPGTTDGAAARVPMRFERTATGRAPTGSSPTLSTGLPVTIRMAFEEYKADPKYTHFKAFAMDGKSGGWGRSWGIPSAAAAMERALYECGKRSAACAVYAVGDTILESVSPEQRAALVLGGAQLTYQGLLTTKHEGRIETSPVTFYLFRGRTEITGTWSRDDPRMMGVITGGVSDTNRATVQMTLTQPCRVEYIGTVWISEGGKTLEASYTGPGCDGVPLNATFTGVRQ